MRGVCRLGFTLVELLVVVTIIGLLIALLLPAVQAAREAARRIQCANHFKQVGLGMQNYHAAHQCFPPGMIVWDSRWPADGSCGSKPSTEYQGFGWSALTLPYLEQQALFNAINFNGWWSTAGSTRTALAARVDVFLCPSDLQGGELVTCCGAWQVGVNAAEDVRMTNMAGVSDSTNWTCNGIAAKQLSLVDGAMGNRQPSSLEDFHDGTSNTLLIGEVTGGGRGSYSAHFWGTWDLLDTKDGINSGVTVPGGGSYPGFRGTGFSSFHPGGCHFTMVDGSVQFVSQNVAAVTLKALTTRSGSESISGTAY